MFFSLFFLSLSFLPMGFIRGKLFFSPSETLFFARVSHGICCCFVFFYLSQERMKKVWCWLWAASHCVSSLSTECWELSFGREAM